MDVTEWLHTLGLGEYAPAFRANQIDDRVLPNLTSEDLRELGVTAVGPRRRILDAIATLDPTPRTGEIDSSPSNPTGAERRQLTVLFCDLVGSTPLSSRLDPEDLRGVIAGYYSQATEVIARHGGHVARYIGDGLLAYFGYPQANEHDAERAVRAGLAIVDAVGQMPGPEQLQVRIGIATGVVVVGDLLGGGGPGGRGAVGETPNLAARLQTLASPNDVVIAPHTHALVGGLFEYEDLGAQALKGLPGPVRAWRVVGESTVEDRFEALRAGRRLPLVGRLEELQLLLRHWQRARGGEGQVVLLSGEAGIGSRAWPPPYTNRSRRNRTGVHLTSAHPTIRTARSIRLSPSSSGRLDSKEETHLRGSGQSWRCCSPPRHVQNWLSWANSFPCRAGMAWNWQT